MKVVYGDGVPTLMGQKNCRFQVQNFWDSPLVSIPELAVLDSPPMHAICTPQDMART